MREPEVRILREGASKNMSNNGTLPHRLNSFFSGIGGFELAFARSGFGTQFQCENDSFCRSVLKRHWPSVQCAQDIKTLAPRDIPVGTVWTAGFPCQDLSLAKVPHGRSGFRGAQSSLFFPFYKLISEALPTVVVLENVAGLLNSHKGEDFKILIESLTHLGYAVAWRVLNARYFGVPQSRPRVFICAWMNDPRRAVSALFESEPAHTPRNERSGFLEPTICHRTGAVVPLTSYCVSATSARHTGLDWSRTYIPYLNGTVRRPTPLECERLQGFPDGWSVPRPDGFSTDQDTERYRAVGNAIAIPVGEWISQRISSLLRTQSGTGAVDETPTCHTGSVNLRSFASEFRVKSAREGALHADGTPTAWKRGGVAYLGHLVHAPASTAPINAVQSRLIDFLEKRDVASRYFLSPNAARGVIRRVDRGGRSLFEPLDQNLRRLAANALPSCVPA